MSVELHKWTEELKLELQLQELPPSSNTTLSPPLPVSTTTTGVAAQTPLSILAHLCLSSTVALTAFLRARWLGMLPASLVTFMVVGFLLLAGLRLLGPAPWTILGGAMPTAALASQLRA